MNLLKEVPNLIYQYATIMGFIFLAKAIYSRNPSDLYSKTLNFLLIFTSIVHMALVIVNKPSAYNLFSMLVDVCIIIICVKRVTTDYKKDMYDENDF